MAYHAAIHGPEQKAVQKVLKNKDGALEPIREKIRNSRKPRLRTVEHYLCDECDRIISEPSEGYIIHGNVYTADTSCCGGLIGNNFPDSDEPIDPASVTKTVLCRMCFMKALGLFEPPQSKRKSRSVDELWKEFGQAEMLASR